MAAIIMARHQVQDYSAWREVFDGAEHIRQQCGHLGAEVLTAPGNKNDILVIARFPTLEDAQGFAGSSELREAMSRAGVTSALRVEIVTEVS